MDEENHKSMTLQDRISRIYEAVHRALHPRPLAQLGDVEIAQPEGLWVREVYDGYVIVTDNIHFYKLAYEQAEDGAVSLGEGQLEPVEMEWVPAGKAVLWQAKAATTSPISNALKAVSETDDELVVENYIVLFGGRDLEGVASPNKNVDGSNGQYFSAKTVFDSPYTDTGVLHVDFEHGYDPDKLGVGENDILGRVEWKSAKRDERGIFVRRVLNRRNAYVRYLEDLIREGLIGNSSEAIPEKVEIGRDGEIKAWPLKRDTLTVNPMEPRMLSQNALTALKALGRLPEIDAPVETPEAGGEPAAVEPAAVKSTSLPTNESEITMAEEESKTVPVVDTQAIAAALEPMVKAAVKSEFASLAAEAPVKTGAIATGEAPAVIIGGKGHNKKALFDYIRTGKAALQEGTTTEGGYLVPDDFLPEIIAKRDEMSIARRAGARVIQTSRDVINIPVEDTKLTNFVLTAEEAAADEAEPTFNQVAVTVYKYTKLIKVSEELLADNDANLEAFLSDAFARSWALTENAAVIAGSGSSQPQGVLAGGTAGLTLDSATAIGVGEIPELYFKLGSGYIPGAVWTMEQATMGYLQGLTGNPFNLVATPPANGVGLDWNLWGHRVLTSDSMESKAAGKKSLIFGNWNYYALVERKGMTIRRLNELYAANGQVGILATVRFGGAVLQAEAFQYATQAAS